MLLSTNKNIRYPQNLTGWKIALVDLCNQQWPLVKLHLEKIAAGVEACTAASYVATPRLGRRTEPRPATRAR